MDFFSYASSDRAIAEVIHRELTARRVELWWDKERVDGRGLAPGQTWVEALDTALSAAKGYLVLCGARGVARWVQWEMDIAIRRAVDDPQFRIIPLVLDTAARGELPPRLAAYQTVALDGDLLNWPKERWDELAASLGRGGSGGMLSVPVERSPIPGLASFEEADEPFFYGRDRVIGEALARLGQDGEHHRRWLQIEGASGSGKSSLTRAGIIPALKRRRTADDLPTWRVLAMKPGAEPITQLAQAVVQGFGLGGHVGVLDEVEKVLRTDGRALSSLLRQYRNGASILLLVDQLEEVCTLAPPAEREQLDALLHGMLRADDPLYLLTTIRADFAGRVAEFARLGELLNQDRAARYLLRPIEANQIVSTIVGPLHRVGVRAEAGLPQRIQEETRGEDQRLPLLGHVLRELWERRDHDQLTNEAFESLGGLAGAISHSADHVMNGLSAGQLERVRDLFVTLVHVGRGTRDTRQAVTHERALALLGGGDATNDEAEGLLVRLSGGRHAGAPADQPAPTRLLVVDVSEKGSRVDLVHEVLIDRWQTLAEWVSADRRLSERREDLEAAAQVWESTIDKGGRRKADLPTGATLDYYDCQDLAEPERQRYDRVLARRERAYLAAARKARSEHEARERAHTERERRRRQGRLLGLSIGAVLVLAALTAFAFSERGRATKALALADHRLEQAVQVAQLINSTVDSKLRALPGAAPGRRELLDASAKLLDALSEGAEQASEVIVARTTTHIRRGDLALDQDDLAAARNEYEASLELAETLIARDPDGDDGQRGLSVSLSRLGDLAQAADDFAAAQGFYERALKIFETQLAKDPNPAEWQYALAGSLRGLGDLAQATGDLAAAQTFYERDLKIVEALAAKDPNQADWQRAVSASLSGLGDLAEAAGDVAGARSFYERGLQIDEALAAKHRIPHPTE